MLSESSLRKVSLLYNKLGMIGILCFHMRGRIREFEGMIGKICFSLPGWIWKFDGISVIFFFLIVYKNSTTTQFGFCVHSELYQHWSDIIQELVDLQLVEFSHYYLVTSEQVSCEHEYQNVIYVHLRGLLKIPMPQNLAPNINQVNYIILSKRQLFLFLVFCSIGFFIYRRIYQHLFVLFGSSCSIFVIVVTFNSFHFF